MMVRLLALLFAVCLTSAAEAQVLWSSPGSGCAPADVTTKFDRHLVGNASVRHAANNVDLIVLTCPIPRFSSGTTNWELFLTYQDSTGTATSAFVRARIYRMEIFSATPVLMATSNSNTSAATGTNTVLSPAFAHTFDFDQYIYWVHVDLDRSSTSQTAIFHASVLAQAGF